MGAGQTASGHEEIDEASDDEAPVGDLVVRGWLIGTG
jgi:hypothetical protein